MDKRYLYTAIILLLILAGLQRKAIKDIRADKARYEANTNTLLDSITHYKVRDSLNAVERGVLQLTIKEYKRHRAEDAELIADLRQKGRSLQGISSLSTRTEYVVSANVRDTIIERDTIKINARCVDYDDNYLSLHGCEEGGRWHGEVCVRDSLLVVESVRYKRFLGFLWRTRKIKDRKVSVVSRNPHTAIEDTEHIIIVR